MKKNIIVYFFLLNVACIFAQTPQQENTKNILLINGVAHLGNGKVISNSAIGISKSKLTLVADATKIRIDRTAFDTIINIEGKHVYPGFISPNSTLGLVEIGAVRATRDYNEIGQLNPHVRSIIAYNTESKITATIRTNGVLLGQITPRGGLISGTSSVVEFEGWNWEDAVYKLDDGIHLNWPRMINPWTGKENKNYTKSVDVLDDFFINAKSYSNVKKDDYQEKNIRFEASRGLFNATKSLYIHVDYVKEITEAVNFVKKHELKNVVFVGAHDAWLVPELLKENNIAIMLKRIHSLPAREDEDVDLPYKLPKLLYDAGLLVCLENSGDMEAMGTRNLPFYAGTASTYGLDKEIALMMITLNTAKILRIDKTLGSIEPEKDATIIVSTGDALDMKTNNIEMAFVRGKQIDLTNHQKELYKKYTEKYKN